MTGVDYAVNRSYSSAQGRFTSVDPIGMQATSLDNPQTLNLYNYCGNDPINRTDPDGQSWLSKLWKAIKFIVKIIIAVVVSILAVVSFMHGDVYGGLQFLQKALDAWGDVFKNDLLHKMARMLSIALGGYDYLKSTFSREDGEKRGSFFGLIGAIAGLLKDNAKQIKNPCEGKILTYGPKKFYTDPDGKKYEETAEEHIKRRHIKGQASSQYINPVSPSETSKDRIFAFVKKINLLTVISPSSVRLEGGYFKLVATITPQQAGGSYIGTNGGKRTLVNAVFVNKDCQIHTSYPQ